MTRQRGVRGRPRCMHPLAAPGTLWVLSSDGKVPRPPAGGRNLPTRSKLLVEGRKRAYPFFSRINKGFRLCGGRTRGLSDGPLDPFGAHPCMRERNLPQETAFLRQAGKGPTFPSRIAKGFASAEATRGLSGRSATSIGAAFRRLFRLRKAGMLSRHWRLCLPFPLDPFGAHPCMRGRNSAHETPSLWRAWKRPAFPPAPLGAPSPKPNTGGGTAPLGAFHRLSSFIPLWSVPIPPLLQDAS